jgi:predicted kinase
MPTLLFLNGPPASGKSTIAARLVAERPMALNLDIDTVRGLLGAWLDHPSEAGLLARELALVMARTHLVAGHDVVIPQFVGRPEFLERLEQLASSVGARFVEIALVMDRWDAVDAFAERRAAPHSQAHLDAAALVDRSESDDPVGEMWDRYSQLLATRSAAHRVEVRRDDIDGTVDDIERVL